MTLFPFDYAEQYLARANPGLERDGLTLRWPAFDGVTELTVLPVNERTSHGLTISEIVTLTHRSPLLADADAASYALLNRLATLSALTPENYGEPTVLRARLSIFSQDQQAVGILYGSLLCQEAALVGWHAAPGPRHRHRGAGHEPATDDGRRPTLRPDRVRGHPGAVRPLVVRRLHRRRRVHRGTALGPGRHDPHTGGARPTPLYAQGAYSKECLDRMAGLTSLVTIKPETHHLIGKGLRCSLEIPLPADDGQSAAIARDLNRQELACADLPPHLVVRGASDRGRRPTSV